MRFADNKTYLVTDDVENLLEQHRRSPKQSNHQAAKRALRRADRLMYDAVGTEDHGHWCAVRNELARLAVRR